MYPEFNNATISQSYIIIFIIIHPIYVTIIRLGFNVNNDSLFEWMLKVRIKLIILLTSILVFEPLIIHVYGNRANFASFFYIIKLCVFTKTNENVRHNWITWCMLNMIIIHIEHDNYYISNWSFLRSCSYNTLNVDV